MSKPLLAAYRQGLSPQVRLHLAAHEDAIGLERLIQLSIRIATHMQSCVHRSQDQSHPPQQARLTTTCQPSRTSSRAHATGDDASENPPERPEEADPESVPVLWRPGACSSHVPHPSPAAHGEYRLLISSSYETTHFPMGHSLLLARLFSVVPPPRLWVGSQFRLRGPSAASSDFGLRPRRAPYQIRCITGKPISRRRVHHSAGPVLLQVGLPRMWKRPPSWFWRSLRLTSSSGARG
ncbi:hypothetical protein QTP86_000804 [Hemibagrus guttatus]|nr:hypothetical protein QTP86_000804 [Hemibagrus guttatus]